MRKVLSASLLILSLAVYAAAVQVEDTDVVRNDLVKNSFVSGDIIYSLYAPANVNVFRLVKDVGLAGGETANTIRSKINDLRMKLCPDAEIILNISGPSSAVQVGPTLVKLIQWWNKATASGQSWSATATSTLVVLFVDNVKSGQYKIYAKYGASWGFIHTVTTGDHHTEYYSSALSSMGYKGVATGASKADIVIWFFK